MAPPRPHLSVYSLDGIPRVQPGDDLAGLLLAALSATGLALAPGDVLTVTSKLLSRAEGRFVDLASVSPTAEARALAERVDKDPRLVTLILQESTAVSRQAPGVLITRHRLGCICANAGIDGSNAAPPAAVATTADAGPFVLLLPTQPDASAAALRADLEQATGVAPAVVVTDSQGRPFRLGTTGVAIGSAGLPALWDRRGTRDLDGRRLEHTLVATADQIAATADLLAGQADEGRPVCLLRGLGLPRDDGASAQDLVRPPQQDLYA